MYAKAAGLGCAIPNGFKRLFATRRRGWQKTLADNPDPLPTCEVFRMAGGGGKVKVEATV